MDENALYCTKIANILSDRYYFLYPLSHFSDESYAPVFWYQKLGMWNKLPLQVATLNLPTVHCE